MPNLVGIGNSQVPTNAMLGGLAYQNSVGEINIEKIKANISTFSATIDIFVYDTRKDSDGGAWRKRTQNTSWYNEGASSMRGSRKEFPAVAVLVLEGNYLTIYDGDDPTLPMWMVFNCNSSSMVRVPSPSSVAMLNAKLVVGEHNNYAGSTIDFILDAKDSERDLRQTVRYGNIADRNDTTLQGVNGSRLAIGQHTNDVAMIVLPNAPIDPATGLPIPTIAVATNAGFTVIKDTIPVSVAHKQTSGAEAHQVAWLGTSKLVGTAPLYYGIFEDPFVHVSSDLGYVSGGAESNYYYGPGNWKNTPNPLAALSTSSKLITTDDRTIVTTTVSGLNIHQISESSIVDNNDGLMAYITTEYNSGWQLGNIQGAFLSNIVTEKDGVNYALQATEYGTGRLQSESYDNGDTSFHMADDPSSDNGYLAINFNGLTVGQTYKITMTRSAHAHLDAGFDHRIDHNHGTAGQTYFYHWDNNTSSSHVVTGVFVAKTSDDDDLVMYSHGAYIEISDFKVEETDDIRTGNVYFDDFSNNNKGWSFADNSGGGISGGVMTITTQASARATDYDAFSGVATGTRLSVKVTVTFGAAGTLNIDDDGAGAGIGGNTNLLSATRSGSGTQTFNTIYTKTASNRIRFIRSSGGNFQIDNFEIKTLAVEDRSVNGDGLAVYGEVSREPVAPGAELLAYGGFSSSNYLQQPYNSNLDFGTGNWCFMFWYNANDAESGDVLFTRWSYNLNSSTAGRIGVYFNNGNLRCDTTDDGASSYQGHVGADGTQDTNTWHCGVILRRAGNLEVWVDGLLRKSNVLDSTSDGSYTNTSAILEIGNSPNMGAADSGIQLALLRVSKTAPSEKQIEKIYNDEKKLFHDNAKCTLIGTNSNITTVAHDDTTKILYVGTGSGRSDFRELKRINSTTEAIGSAISASNGLVAED